MISVILLAAGASRRMGKQDKLALAYQGQSMLEHTIRQLRASAITELIVVRPSASKAFLPTDLSDQVTIAVNPNPDRGMTSSILAGLPLLHPETNGVMIALADMPLLLTADYNRIIGACREAVAQEPGTIAVPFFEGRKGNPVIFSTFFLNHVSGHV